MAGSFKDAFQEATKSIVDRIIQAMNCPEQSAEVREEITQAILKSLRAQKKPPTFENLQATNLHRYANIVKECMTFEKYEERVKTVFSGKYMHFPSQVLKSFGRFPWKYKFEFPANSPYVLNKRQRKEARPPVALETNELVQFLKKEFLRLNEELVSLRAEFAKFKNHYLKHIHANGKLYVEDGMEDGK